MEGRTNLVNGVTVSCILLRVSSSIRRYKCFFTSAGKGERVHRRKKSTKVCKDDIPDVSFRH